jgi:hypothetical protein
MQIASSHIHKGIILALMVLLYKTILLATNNYYNDIYLYIGWAFIVIGIALSLFIFQKLQDNKLMFNGLLSHGLKTSAVLACISFVGMLLLVYVVFPNMPEDAVINFAKNNNASISKESYKPDDFTRAKKVMALTITAGSLMGNLILGFLGSLIGAILFGKKG